MDDLPLTPAARTLAADLYERFAVALTGRLARRYPLADPQQIADAVVRAVLYLARDFQRYDSRRGSLPGLLLAIARRLLEKSRLADERRLQREEEKARNPVTNE